MTVTTRLPARRARADRLRARRLIVALASAVVVLAFIRTVVNPPALQTIERVPVGQEQPEAAAVAQDFAAAWLSADTADPEARDEALRRFGEPGQWRITTSRELHRTVLGTQISQVAEQTDGTSVYVVQAALNKGSDQYLAVRVAEVGGQAQIVGSPALVGPPAVASALPKPDTQGAAVDDEQLTDVVTRALRNLLARRTEDLPADLAPGTRVNEIPRGLELKSVDELTWTSARQSAVFAHVSAVDAQGVQVALDYELSVRREGARWFITSLHVPALITDPATAASNGATNAHQ